MSLKKCSDFQGLLYVILLFMQAEEPTFPTQYGVYFTPVMLISILLGIYSLTIVTKTLHTTIPGNKHTYLFKSFLSSFNFNRRFILHILLFCYILFCYYYYFIFLYKYFSKCRKYTAFYINII